MARPKKEKQEPKIKIAEVKVTRKYFDVSEGKEIEVGQIMITTQERAKELLNAKVAEVVCLKN